MDEISPAKLSIEEALERSHALRAAGERLIREAEALRILVKAALCSGDQFPASLDPVTFPQTANDLRKSA
jgi:hypothetical protein